MMDNRLQIQLQNEFPTVFKDLWGDPMETCMAWGIDCGDGWYNLIRDLCIILEPQGVYASQIKEKFGTLRFYYIGGNDEVDKAVIKAEEKSATTCEVCGSAGKLIENAGWFKTRCVTHEAT